ncbi:hypothetical protein [uncultured Massilia sp.]|uniref:hypothetical protein n=1 Tax=uncultured Massilia sp. TaxID=169973 RepID=UPI00258CE26E|nr:hypothetical protein [uncultured Massilia sp.]
MSDTLSPWSAARRILPALLSASFLASTAAAAPRKPAVAPLADFTALSGSYPSSCTGPLDPALGGLGAPGIRRCAWSQRVEMLHWRTVPNAGNACLPAPALAWHRLGAGMRTPIAPWSAAWPAQSVLSEQGGVTQAAALWRGEDGQWSAVLWRWLPAERAATRNWQAAHWNDVAQAVRASAAGARAAPTSPLLAAWEDASRGKPRLREPDAARWIADGACLNLQTAGIGQARLHLPHSRDDVRQEQRSAMQVQLARRYPDADWLQSFALVEPNTPGARTGAKFLAVWREGTTVNGQLWITLPGEEGIVRARVSSVLAAARSDDTAKTRAALIQRELTALAHAWEVRHE